MQLFPLFPLLLLFVMLLSFMRTNGIERHAIASAKVKISGNVKIAVDPFTRRKSTQVKIAMHSLVNSRKNLCSDLTDSE